MKPVFQTKLPPAYPSGNCLAAIFASLFELRIEDVPNFEVLQEVHGSLWKTVLEAWLLARGWRLCHAPALLAHHQPFEGDRPAFPFTYEDAPYIATGMVGEVFHAVIYANGRLVHDPTPTGAGLDTFVDVQVLGRMHSIGAEPRFSDMLRLDSITYSTVPQVADY